MQHFFATLPLLEKFNPLLQRIRAFILYVAVHIFLLRRERQSLPSRLFDNSG